MSSKILKSSKSITSRDISSEEGSFYEKVSINIHNSLDISTDDIINTTSDTSKVINNDNLSTSTKATSVALDTVAIGLQIKNKIDVLKNPLQAIAGSIVKALDDSIEQALLPILGKLGMKGLACFPISKQLDPVMGMDIHFVNIPPSPAPIPMPHPYIGILFRAKDFLSVAVASIIPAEPLPPEVDNPNSPTDSEQKSLNANKVINLSRTVGKMLMAKKNLGATVMISSFYPRAVAGTPTKSVPHFPMGAGFHSAFSFADKNIGHSFMGSLLMLADNDPLCGGPTHLHLSCNDIGTYSIHDIRPSKNTETDKNTQVKLYLPTSVVTPIPPSRQIITNPIPSPVNLVTIVKRIFTASLGRFFKKKKKKLGKRKEVDKNEVLPPGTRRNSIGQLIDAKTGRYVKDPTKRSKKKNSNRKEKLPFGTRRNSAGRLINSKTGQFVKDPTKKKKRKNKNIKSKKSKNTIKSKKRAQLKKNNSNGKKRELEVKKELEQQGHKVVGSQVSVKTKHTRRVIDHLIIDKDTGEYKAIEVKSGNAKRNASQVLKDNSMEKEGAEFIGKNCPKELKGKNMKVTTEVVN